MNKKKKLRRLKNIINNKIENDNSESEDIPINSPDITYQKDLEDKDREIEELKKQLAQKNSKKTKNLQVKQTKNMPVNSPDESWSCRDVYMKIKENLIMLLQSAVRNLKIMNQD